jgi:hypothetical protein
VRAFHRESGAPRTCTALADISGPCIQGCKSIQGYKRPRRAQHLGEAVGHHGQVHEAADEDGPCASHRLHFACEIRAFETNTQAHRHRCDKNLFRDLPLGREYHQAPERQNRKVDKRENLPHSRTCCYSTQPGNLTIESPKTCIPRWGMLVLGDSMLACRSGARRHSLEASAGTACRRKLAAASFSRFRGRGQNVRVVAYFQRFAVTRHILAT